MNKTSNAARMTGVTVGLAALALATGCAADSSDSSESEPTTTKTVTATKTVTPKPKTKTKTVTATPKRKSDDMSSDDGDDGAQTSGETAPLKGGSVYKFKNGSKIELVDGQTKTAGKNDALGNEDDLKPGDKYMVYTLKVTNGTKKAADLLASVTETYGEAGHEAPQVYTDESESTGELDGRVLPGCSRTGAYSFAIDPGAKKVVLDVDADIGSWDMSKISFVGE